MASNFGSSRYKATERYSFGFTSMSGSYRAKETMLAQCKEGFEDCAQNALYQVSSCGPGVYKIGILTRNYQDTEYSTRSGVLEESFIEQWILDKVAVLSMLEPYDIVPKIGCRFEDGYLLYPHREWQYGDGT